MDNHPRIGLIGYGKDLDLGHDSLRLVDIPGGLGIGGVIMLPSGCQLGESAGYNGVFSARVTERKRLAGVILTS